MQQKKLFDHLPITKKCRVCNKTKPATKQFFLWRQDNNKFRNTCKTCFNKKSLNHHLKKFHKAPCLQCGSLCRVRKDKKTVTLCASCSNTWTRYCAEMIRYRHTICPHCGNSYRCRMSRKEMLCDDCRHMWSKYHRPFSIKIYADKHKQQIHDRYIENERKNNRLYKNCEYCGKKYYRNKTKNCGSIICKALRIAHGHGNNIFTTKIHFISCLACNRVFFTWQHKYCPECKPERRRRNKQQWDIKNAEHIKTYNAEIQPTHRVNYMKRQLKKFASIFDMSAKELQMMKVTWSAQVRKNRSCAICDKEAQESHHILYTSNYPELSLNLNNGIPLCFKCHAEVHLFDPYVNLIKSRHNNIKK